MKSCRSNQCCGRIVLGSDGEEARFVAIGDVEMQHCAGNGTGTLQENRRKSICGGSQPRVIYR